MSALELISVIVGFQKNLRVPLVGNRYSGNKQVQRPLMFLSCNIGGIGYAIGFDSNNLIRKESERGFPVRLLRE